MLVFNVLGFLFGLLACIAGGLGFFGTFVAGPKPCAEAVAAIVGGLVAIAIDLPYRHRREEPAETSRYVSPDTGGQVMFAPIWILGAVALIVGIWLIAAAPR
ncbi:MAG: hypothetical protein ACHREM_25495 [Polyangiales bacterium]